MCESQSEKAFNEKLARSQHVSGQVPPVKLRPAPPVKLRPAPPVKLRPAPPVMLSQEMGISSEGERKRKNYFTAALCLGIPGVIMLLSPFIYAALLSGYHGNNEDGLAWELFS